MATPQVRARTLLATMTFDEKVALALSDFDALAHLGIPPIAWTDGGNGVRDAQGATVFPTALVLAATFDEALAAEYGAALAAEVRSRRRNVLLGPTVDIARTPLAGRMPEALGEDPYLASRIAVAEVRAIQAGHVIAMVKHFVANNFEWGRTGMLRSDGRGPAVNAVVDERTLRELYMPPFRAAVLEGGAGAVMGSYNRVNGEYACQNGPLLSILKHEWAWPGFVMPDYEFAVRDPLAAARAGIDLGGLDGPSGRTADDFTSGRISPERLDEIAERVLWAMFGAGLFDHPLPDAEAVDATPAHVDLAERVARAGTVMLLNRGALPLDAGLASIAVIGTARDDARYVIGGSAALRLPENGVTTPLDAIAARAGGAVVFAQGSLGGVRLPLMPCPGLRAEYWDGAGGPARVATEAVLDVPGTPAGLGTPWSARWTGEVVPERDGWHRFSLTFAGIAGLYIDDVLVARGAREAVRMIEGPEYPLQALVELRAGRPARLRVEYESGPALIAEQVGLHGPQIQLGWQPPDNRIEDAAQAASECEVAIVFVSDSSGEAMDRASLALPGDQDRLISAVAAANPRTVVVLNTGGPVLMPWLDDVAAVLHVGYPGERFGEAVAAVLFGDADPGGRLPVTFPAAEDDGPVTRPEQYPGVDGDAHYDEGVDVGYRHYDRHDRRPLFPFGQGLSYGDYRYSELEIVAAADAVTVSVDVENVGARSGTEVVQLYIAAPPAARQPPKQLKAFRKLSLRPGETSRVSLRVERDALAVFAAGDWTVFGGRYELLVGRSAGDIRVRGAFAVDG